MAVASADLGSAVAKPQVEAYDQMLQITGGRMTLADQQRALQQLLKLLNTPQKMEPAIQECSWYKVKKGDRYLLKLGLAPSHPLHELVDVIYVVLGCLAASRSDGPPPKGPQARQIGRCPIGSTEGDKLCALQSFSELAKPVLKALRS